MSTQIAATESTELLSDWQAGVVFAALVTEFDVGPSLGRRVGAGIAWGSSCVSSSPRS